MSVDPIYHWNNTIIIGRGIGSTIIDFALSPLFAYHNHRFLEQHRNSYKVLTDDQAWKKTYLSRLIFFQKCLMHNSYSLCMVGASVASGQALRHLSSALPLNAILKSYPFIGGIAVGAIFYKITRPSFVPSERHYFKILKCSLPLFVKKVAIPFSISIGTLGAFYLAPHFFPQHTIQLSGSCLMRSADKLLSITLKGGIFLGFTMGVAALIRRRTWYNHTLRDITHAKENHTITRRTIQNIAESFDLAATGPFEKLPKELLSFIFSYISAEDLPNVNLVARWVLQLCTQERPKWDEQKLRLHLHPHVLGLLKEALGENALNHFQEVKLSGKVIRPAIDKPISSFLETPSLEVNFRPGSGLEWMFNQEQHLTQCLGWNPARWPLMQTLPYFHPAPFPLEMATDVLECPSAAYAWTPAGTLALYFPYTITFYNHAKKGLDTKPGLFMLTQASGFDSKEWLLVYLDFKKLHVPTMGIGPKLHERSPSDSYTFTRFLVYDEHNQLHSDCQTGVEWLFKFLSGKAVGWFQDRQEGPQDPALSGGCSIHFNHPNLKRSRKDCVKTN